MMPMLAHMGGLDEFLLPALAILAVIGLPRLRRHRRPDGAEGALRTAGHACAYCGVDLANDATRCPSCGFRAVGV